MGKSTPVIAIVGRPNVGKSTLFNRLTGKRTAIVDDVSGVTRDRIHGTLNWNGRNLEIIDTGGFVSHSSKVFESHIREQVITAIDIADIILFMVDVQTGITDPDEDFSRLLKKTSKPVLLTTNKADNLSYRIESNIFYKLGFEDLIPISSINGSGTDDLLDKILSLLPKNHTEEETPPGRKNIPEFAVIGRPNVGKSTLINALLGEERNIVTDIPGTTRDAIHTHFKKFKREFILIDTAGIRKKKKIKENLEYYSFIRALRSIEEADVCFLMLNANSGMEKQDAKLAELALSRNKGLVILVNKWDAVEKDSRTHLDYINHIHKIMAPFTDFPVLFISALEKQRLLQALDVGFDVFHNKKKKISTANLNKKMLPHIREHPPPQVKGKLIRIKYIIQLDREAPGFAFFCNFPGLIRENYKRFLENKLRYEFGFEGLPVNIEFKKK